LPSCDTALFWFRRDLRDEDNAGLHHALRSAARVHCIFVFDREILDALPSRRDRRVEFIHGSVAQLRQRLRDRGGELVVLHDRAREAIPAYARLVGADAVFANGDYEPAARARDEAVMRALAMQGRRFHLAKDQALFERDEVLAKSGRPYTVFTPYKNAWLARLDDEAVAPFAIDPIARSLSPADGSAALPSLEALGFEPAGLAELGVVPGMDGARERLERFAGRLADYREMRDFPAVEGGSFLSVHNRFGTVSIRARRLHVALGARVATDGWCQRTWK
jgi:deoxyribodipyrimidine photo-lyase